MAPLFVGFAIGAFVGLVTAALFASTRMAELRDDLEEAELSLARLRARCQREFGAR